VVKTKNLACPLTMATPLPRLPRKGFSPDLESLAYQMYLDLESLALADSSLQRSTPPGLVAAPLLGHLLWSRTRLGERTVPPPTILGLSTWPNSTSAPLSQ